MTEVINLSFDALMEVVRATVVASMLVFLIFLGHRERLGRQKGWSNILFSVGLLTFGCFLDVLDNFPELTFHTAIGSMEAQSILKIFVGYIGGFVFMFFGFISWISMVEELRKSNANTKTNKQESALFSALQSSPNLVAFVNVSDGKIMDVNESWLTTMGYKREEVIGKTAIELNLWPSLADRDRTLSSFGIDGTLHGFEAQLLTKSGKPRDFLLSGSRIAHSGEEWIMWLIHDITNRRKVEAALAESEQELRGILDNMDELYYRADLDGIITFAAGAAKDITGWSASGLVGVNINDRYVDPDGRENLLKALEAGGGVVRNFESLMLHKDGSRGWLSINARFLRNANGDIIGVEGTVRDVSSSVEARDVLEHMAMHDVLTGLANRRNLELHLEEALARSRRSGDNGAVLFFDLDGFKEINDKYGHDAGDTALKITAKRLKSISRETDFVARIGGDEFCAIIEMVHGRDDVCKFATKAIDSMSPPIIIAGNKVYVHASVGVTIFDGDEEENPVHSVISRADRAMYHAKTAGGNTYYLPEDPKDAKIDSKA